MIRRHLHIQRPPRVPEILCRQHSALLADKQRRAVRVAADVIRADGQIRDFQPLDAVHVEALVEDAVLDDRVALAGRHGARAQAVPGGFYVACVEGRGS